MSLKLINTNNYSKETEENLKPYIWNKKNNVNSLKIVAWGTERGRETESCSFSGFFILSVKFFISPLGIKMMNVINNRIFFFKLEDLILKIFTRTRILAWSWRL